ncbi:MAG TPA: serine/threonine-protein kinase [Kofleriaceae bacterium]|nr:serine/threonine-protein kinase [Kofleriaceae bacterium]
MPLLEGDLEHYPRKFGKYHLLGPLAQGGMGALYLAVAGDRGLERLMVIKTVLPHLADAEYVARFRDEAKVVVKLSHGNLIPVFDAGLVGGELFLAMDFVEGRDLRAVWNRCAKKQVAFPIDVAVYIVKELCRGLAYAHAFPDLHLVHRDISPPNVLVSYTGEVKLTDFGLASSTLKLEKTAPGIIYGKVAYMSPEQARGEKLDGRSDMYAAAIVLWELLTGRQLFPPGKDQPQDLLARAKNPEPMRPSKRAPRVPVELDEICLKALAPNKDDRYTDCDAMRMALQSWLAQNAPTTDGTRMAAFLQELFSDDIARERVERNDLLARVRTRALTLPPTDELRLIVEHAGRPDAIGDDSSSASYEAPVRKPGSVGRRASDRNDNIVDRRKAPDRRATAARGSGDASASAAAALAQRADPMEDDADHDLIGSEVDGRYRVLELIGEGGMGKVYRSEHVELGSQSALKVLHPSYSRMPDLVERFRREARAAAQLNHPNIVGVTDSGTTADGSVYFVMEYLEGLELGSVIEREGGGGLDVARSLKITGQICRALAAAHRAGIIHRDLKPENIFLVTRDGTADVVKVLDFGIAKTTEAEAQRERRLTSPGMAMGTPEYMSPEQAAGRPADARCDVYALGAILYEMVTGIPPYSGDNFMEILTKKATQDPLPPQLVRSELPQQVSDLVMQATARNPADRPQTMEAFEYELNKCLSGRGVAVAQILGMTTDAHVVATLNPGLSMRTFDDGPVVSRAQTASSPAIALRAGTHSGMTDLQGMWSGPAMATGQAAMMARPAAAEPSASGSYPGSAPGLQLRAQSQPVAAIGYTPTPAPLGDPNLYASQPVMDIRRSPIGVFGWIVVAALLFGGVAALGYFALGERDAIKASADAALRSSNEASKPASAPAVVEPAAAAPAPAPTGDGSDAAAKKPAVVEPDAVTGPGASAPASEDGKHALRRGAAAGDTFQSLLVRGKALERQGKYKDARAVYSQLELMPHANLGEANYLVAWAAYKSNAADAADLASKAAQTGPGPFKLPSQELYGDALFAQNEFGHARNIFVALRKTFTGADRARVIKKIRACNAKLGVAASTETGN